MEFEPAGAASNEQTAVEPMFQAHRAAPTQITVEASGAYSTSAILKYERR